MRYLFRVPNVAPKCTISVFPVTFSEETNGRRWQANATQIQSRVIFARTIILGKMVDSAERTSGLSFRKMWVVRFKITFSRRADLTSHEAACLSDWQSFRDKFDDISCGNLFDITKLFWAVDARRLKLNWGDIEDAVDSYVRCAGTAVRKADYQRQSGLIACGYHGRQYVTLRSGNNRHYSKFNTAVVNSIKLI